MILNRKCTPTTSHSQSHPERHLKLSYTWRPRLDWPSPTPPDGHAVLFILNDHDASRKAYRPKFGELCFLFCRILDIPMDCPELKYNRNWKWGSLNWDLQTTRVTTSRYHMRWFGQCRIQRPWREELAKRNHISCIWLPLADLVVIDMRFQRLPLSLDVGIFQIRRQLEIW